MNASLTAEGSAQAIGMEEDERAFGARTAVLVELSRHGNKPGTLNKILQAFQANDINLSHIESKLHAFAYDGLCFNFDMEARPNDPRVKKALREIRYISSKVEVISPKEVAWFPANLKELDNCVTAIGGGDEGGLISPDHPGFNDKQYLKRRQEIADYANSFQYGDRHSKVQYTPDEVKVWGAVFNKLKDYHKRWACEEYNAVFPDLAREAGFTETNIPQLGDISEYLKSKTGFQLRPVCGLLSARDFLNALAFRTFCSTQYIRHGANPFYTPEPDVCHELIGHVPLLADPNFADFTQEVGLASLGASDEEIARLASIYWFTVEFGLVKSRPDPETGVQSIKVMG